MSPRPGRWHLLGHDGDPVVGDAGAVHDLAAGYAATAEEVQTLTGQLRRLSDLREWNGQAAEKFAAAADDTAGELGKAEERYRGVAAAVRAWAGPLEHAQAESGHALDDAERADQQRSLHRPGAPLPPDATPEQVQHEQARQRAEDAAEGDLQAARRRLDRALEALDTAATRAASAIRDAADSFSDSWWDDVKGAVRSFAAAAHLKTIVDALGYVALAIAAVALFAALVLTSPAWLPALLVVGVVVGGTMLVVHSALVVSDSGDATWTDVAWDVVGLVPVARAGRLLRGVGEALPVLRGDMAREAELAARAVAEAAERGLPDAGRVRSGLHIGDPTNNLRRWADAWQRSSADRVQQVGDFFSDRIASVPDVAPALRQRLRHLDEEVARAADELARLHAFPEARPVLARLAEIERDVASVGRWNAAALAAQLADATDQVGGDLGFDAAQWKQKLTDLVTIGRWRLTLPG